MDLNKVDAAFNNYSLALDRALHVVKATEALMPMFDAAHKSGARSVLNALMSLRMTELAKMTDALRTAILNEL